MYRVYTPFGYTPVKLCSCNCVTNLLRRVNDISNIRRRSSIRFDLYVDLMHVFFTACHGIEIDRDRSREKRLSRRSRENSF